MKNLDREFENARNRRSRLRAFRLRAERIRDRWQSLSFEELNGIYSQESVPAHLRSEVCGWWIGPIIETFNDDTIQVVVQGFMPYCRFADSPKHGWVDGFRRRRDGTIEAMTERELWAYD